MGQSSEGFDRKADLHKKLCEEVKRAHIDKMAEFRDVCKRTVVADTDASGLFVQIAACAHEYTSAQAYLRPHMRPKFSLEADSVCKGYDYTILLFLRKRLEDCYETTDPKEADDEKARREIRQTFGNAGGSKISRGQNFRQQCTVLIAAIDQRIDRQFSDLKAEKNTLPEVRLSDRLWLYIFGKVPEVKPQTQFAF